ncbi:MAG TPA: S-layer protein [Verrucomicrobiales bacterium]|nr:S-layer protein [Verrucomicrobiales bacterium]
MLRKALLFICIATTSLAAEPLSFVRDIQPILTKTGCNAGACHAKAITGQRGFRLSVLGFEPEEDYEAIVKQGKGRRVFPPAPEESLLITKGAAIVPHTGGKKIEPGSEHYQTLVRWIAEGMPYEQKNEPKLTEIAVEPSRITLQVKTAQQLKVTARYSDGSSRDVTKLALFEANDTAMASATDNGLVQTQDLPGNVAVMVRFGGKVSVCSVSVPLGAPVDALPPVKNFIDQHIFANLKQIGIPPSPICDDSTFLRRVSLDIGGRLPTLEETKAFIADKAPDKRDRVVEALLNSPDYADFFANKWTALLKNQRTEAADITANFAFHAWMRDSLLANTPYDQIVRQILASTGTIVSNPPVAWYKRVKEPTTQVEDVAQLFLGVRMQCAQCHHHPFERWTQAEYYHMAAFFSQIGRKPTAIAGEDLIFHKRGTAQTEHRKTRAMLKPAGLGEPEMDIAPDDDPRLALADWMSKKENPFFAKALVNRYWKHFFKRGLIEPEDDLRDTNPPTNPELLDALSKHFLDSNYDLKSLVRVIAQSHAYQLSAMPNEHNAVDRQAYSHYYPKRMPAEVLLDSIDMVTASKTDFADLPAGTRAISLPDNSYTRASPFLKVFGRPDNTSVCECERVSSASLAQSLHLMNAPDVKAKLTATNGRADQLTKAEMPEPKRIRELYLAAYSREPTADEVKIAETHLLKPRNDAAGKPLDSQRAKRNGYEDLLWALMNTKEFLFNH